MRRIPWLLAVLALAFGIGAVPRNLISRPAVNPDFVHFESGQVRPLALTPSGDRLLAVNTPDNRLVVFDLTGGTPSKLYDLPVGLEPVSVAALSDSEAWVVNQLSDDVSIVNLQTRHVRATLRVGDEPGDIVFAAGSAWVSVSQEDAVKRYNTATLALQSTIAINGRMPRALARSASGGSVFVAVLNGGNRTSVLSAPETQDSLPPPNPTMDSGLPTPPHVGLIVKQQGGDWRDESGKLWNSKIKYSQFDTDVAEINTATNSVTRSFADIGTVNFGLAVNPVSGVVAVSGTEARNLTRFENNLRGHIVDTRLGLITTAGATSIADLNPHINYSVTPGPQTERDSSLGLPTALAWSPDGQRVYVTSLASDKLGVLDAAGVMRARVPTVGGPSGIAVDAARQQVYVLGRFQNVVQTLATSNFSARGVASLGFDPTPDAIVNGRHTFYGGFTSGHGDQACASCHTFGDLDNIAWDLGNPRGAYLPAPPGMIDPLLEGFHPMKGPMVTQSLRGIANTGVLHWRGDRANLDAFNAAFVDLMGRSAPLPDSQMAAFDAFVLPLSYPPNPNQFLDRTYRDAPPGQPSAKRGNDFYFGTVVDGPLTCNGCHAATTFTSGTNGQLVNDAALLQDQDIKIPQLRNLYKKTGFTDLPGVTNKRGFGFTHDGSTDNLFNFLHFPGFNFAGPGPPPDEKRRDVEAFLLAFDTGMAPAVGRQITFSGANNNDAALIATLDTLRNQAGFFQYCDLIAKGRVGGTPRGWLYIGSDLWQSDRTGDPVLNSSQLRSLGALGSEVTVTGVPLGSGTRMGIDRDRDTYPDGDELAAGSDPGNPASTPLNVGVVPGAQDAFAFQSIGPNPFRATTEIRLTLGRASRVDAGVYDVLGRSVRTLARDEWHPAGAVALRWDGRDASGSDAGTGVYFVRVRTEGGSWTKSVVRVR